MAFYKESPGDRDTEGEERIDLEKIPLKYLVSDMIQWNPTIQKFHNCLAFDLPKTGYPSRLYRQLRSPNNNIFWVPSFREFVPLHNEAYLYPPPPVHTQEDPPLNTTEWLPKCDHWILRARSSKPAPISRTSIGDFRQYMQVQHIREKENNTKLITTSGIVHTPFAITRNYFSPLIWAYFWNIRLPHKVVTVWWRLLQDRIGYHETLTRWNPQTWPSSICTICQAGNENNQHFFVSCNKKWAFWVVALEELKLTASFPTPDTVWTALYLLHSQDNSLVPEDNLISLGLILECIWKYHWRCIFDEVPWNDLAINSLFESALSRTVVTSPYLTDITKE
jgi:hypothetical protein